MPEIKWHRKCSSKTEKHTTKSATLFHVKEQQKRLKYNRLFLSVIGSHLGPLLLLFSIIGRAVNISRCRLLTDSKQS